MGLKTSPISLERVNYNILMLKFIVQQHSSHDEEASQERNAEVRHLKLLKRIGLKFFGKPKQIPLIELYPSARKGDHLELDAIGYEGKTGFIIESTIQRQDNGKKIKKFINHAEIFLSSSQSWKKKLSFFDVPSTAVENFDEITEWKFVYMGESKEILTKQIKKEHFPAAKGKLTILNIDDIDYLELLSRLIGPSAKYEFLGSLNVSSSGAVTRLEKEFLKVQNRYVSSGKSAKADLYLLSFSPKELLEIGRVFRYSGMPVSLEQVGKGSAKGSYQRVLIPDKLRSINADFIRNDFRKSFPNTITIVLSQDCKEEQPEGKTLLIPNRYASVDILDGQHRVFAYAANGISDKTREESQILASAIKFKTGDVKEINKFAAKIFWEINSKQTTVKRDLLYLIKYNVLGDKDPIALAGEVIRHVNESGKTLDNVFKTKPLRKKNRFDVPPIPIVTIVEELSLLLNAQYYKSVGGKLEANFAKTFEMSVDEAIKNPGKIISQAERLLESFFLSIMNEFTQDWKPNSKSNLLSTNYIAALIRILRILLMERGIPASELDKTVKSLMANLQKALKPTGLVFDSNNTRIPPKKFGVKKISDFLISYI